MKLRIVVMGAVMAGSALLMPAAQADGGPKIITGWMPYWMTSQSKPAGITSAVTNADVLKDVSPFWFSAVAGGPAGVTVKFNPNFGSAEANATWAVGQLRGAGLAILPSIADGSGKGRMAATLADPAKRAQHVADIVNLVTSRGYDGIDLDYETFAFTDGRASWPATQPNWTAFVNELSAALHAQGKLLAVTIPSPCDVANKCGGTNGYWVYNLPGIAAPADRIRIMTYDFHVGSPGAIAPIGWVTASMQYAVTQAPANKLTVGVPAYGRAWTKKNGSSYALSGVCPASASSGATRTAYNSLTSSASLTAAEIPAFLASIGKTQADVQWDPVSQENWIEYDKSVNWTDGNGAAQTCVAKRIMWWIGPQVALVRTQLVGQLGLNSAGFWTIGGDDPAMWPLLRGYAASMAPATTAVAVTAPASVTFNTVATISAVVTSQGVPVTGVDAALQFQNGGKGAWVQTAAAPLAADGTVSFAPTLTSGGKWRVFIPAAAARGEQASEAKLIPVTSVVKANAKKSIVKPKSKLVIRVVALPAQAGQPVMVQEQRAGQWIRVGKSVTQATGVARVVLVAPKATGVHTYQATASTKGALGAGVSAPFTVTVQ
ncbi:MAG: glycosyl hydrolase family 18 protein [Candidatus Nanopelagicales bacterium]|nr:glycosyl hydrolase family 18 protein [Candidatus Nanopelagicales bacterium]